MKKITVYLLILCLSCGLFIGCNSSKEYDIKVSDMTYGKVTTDKTQAKKDEVVSVTVKADAGYMLKENSLQQNGKAIIDNKFTMVKKNVVITAEFVKAPPVDPITSTSVSISAGEDVKSATSHWYAKYNEYGININVKVEDNSVSSGGETFEQDDNIEFIIGLKSSKTTLDIDYNYRMLVTASGDYFLQKAKTVNTFGDKSALELNIAPGINLVLSAAKTSKLINGYDGYSISIFLSYDLINTDYGRAFDNLTFCPVLTNADNQSDFTRVVSDIDGCIWANASTFIPISAN